MTEKSTDLVLGQEQQQTGELAISAQQMMAQKEIECAIIVAQKFPRNEEAAFSKIIRSAKRWSFASAARYSYPRKSKQGPVKVAGPSVHMAREMARCWGNIRYGADIVYDDETSRTVRCWAWDVETNTRESQDVTFKKLVQREGGAWMVPNERDLRELTNNNSARGVRNCIIHMIPHDLVEDVEKACTETMSREIAKDPDEARKKLIVAFGNQGVTVGELEEYLGHPVRQATTKEIADLRAVWKSLHDGNSIWKEYMPKKESSSQPEGAVTMDDLTGAAAEKPKRGRPKKGPEPEPEPADAHPWTVAIADVKALPDAKKQIQGYNSLIEQAKDQGEQEAMELLKVAIKASIAISEAAKGALLGSIEL